MSRPLFLASLGNPGPQYMHTRHSAGHILLRALALVAGAPPMLRERRWSRAEMTQQNDTIFWCSPEYMNASGSPIASAWRTFLDRHPPRDRDAPHLVVFHDELELDLGLFSFKTATGASPRGHNGLKSLLSMPGMRDTTFSRVGVGIGPRPLERDPDIVASFVLGTLEPAERDRVEKLAPRVWSHLQEFRTLKHDEEEAPPPGGGEGPPGSAEKERWEWEMRLRRQDKELQLEDELILAPGRRAAEARRQRRRHGR